MGDRREEVRGTPLQRVPQEPGRELTVARTVDLPVRTLTVAPRDERTPTVSDAGGPAGRGEADPVFVPEAAQAELVGDRPPAKGAVEPVVQRMEAEPAGRVHRPQPVGVDDRGADVVSAPLVGDRPLVQGIEQPPALVEARQDDQGPEAVSVPLVGARPPVQRMEEPPALVVARQDDQGPEVVSVPLVGARPPVQRMEEPPALVEARQDDQGPEVASVPLVGDRPLATGSVEPAVQRIEPLSTTDVNPPEVATPAAPVQRRLGLGAPLSAPPPSVQRSASPPQVQLPLRSRVGEPMPEVPRLPETPAPDRDREVAGPVVGDPLPPGETVAPLLADSPPMVLQRTEASPPETDSAVAPVPMPPRAEPGPQVRAGGESQAVRPVPLQSSRVPRPEPEGRVGLVGERGLELRAAPTPVQRTDEDAQGQPLAAVPEARVASVGGVPAPRPPSVQRVIQAAAPRVAPPAPKPTDPGSVAVAAGIAQRMPDGSVLFAPPLPVPGPESPPATLTQLPYVQRVYEPQPEPAPVQRAPDPPSPDPPPAAPPEPATTPQASAPPPPPPQPQAAQAESTDDLVRRLIDPLSRLLRAELRLDRERAGLRLDGRN
ncbi:hypothetical protein [Kitasatospora atroaurantiaca]|uniref:hypothetical protein n=1 Tax=Kitasatospora atroaurantiaca TaxID=285545 RepID=UPI0011A05D72|nr:hypothetical protein [Kitasatospora atroaurantiaca]